MLKCMMDQSASREPTKRVYTRGFVFGSQERIRDDATMERIYLAAFC